MRIKNAVKSILSLLHRHKKSEADIFIFSLPRAGTTLLTEILNSDSNSKTASESLALNKDNYTVLRKYFEEEFLVERYVDISDSDLEKLYSYYSDLSQGKSWNSYYWSDLFTKNHNFSTKRTIFKTHKITYYFQEMMRHFKDDVGLYLLRHPVSHSLSRERKKWTTYIDLYAEAKHIKEILPGPAKEIIDRISDSGTNLEKFIVSWCLENYIFIRAYQDGTLPDNIYPVFYEDLVMNPEPCIRDICEKTGMHYSADMLGIVDVPSSGIVHSTDLTEVQIRAGNKNYLVNRWKDELEDESVRQVHSILSAFDIRIYSEKP
jgi:hypothetical protein